MGMAPDFAYPPARQSDVVDTLHGIPVADPYRWLEDPASPETIAWVEAQNARTRRLLDVPLRRHLMDRLTELYDYPRSSVPVERCGRYFISVNSGLQNQGVFFVHDGLDGPGRVLMDPNALSADGTVALTAAFPSEDGALVAYALSSSGSDRQELSVKDVVSGLDLTDRIRWVKFASVAWTKDNAGFYYTRFPAPGTVAPADENYFNTVWYHRLGEPQERDAFVFGRPDEREVVFNVEVSDDDRWVVITAFRGASDRSEVYLLDRREPGATPVGLFTGFESAHAFIDSADGRLFFRTDEGAPRGRIIALNPEVPGGAVEIVGESADKLSSALIVNNKLVAGYLHNASDRIRLFELSGEPSGTIVLPGIGSITGMTGRPGGGNLFLGFTSFTHPPTNYRYDVVRRVLTKVGIAPARVDSSDYETSQVWYPSKDGTPISMFLVHRRDITPDGARPVLLNGYGGFNVNMTPAFDPALFVLLDAGGVFALANLRGGGEYGEAWHQAGMLERKQNVFDDFIAGAEWLVRRGWTTPKRIAIEGGSNGGLLTAAVMLQRPDLFGAVVCRVPVADMLRYHLFTVGRFWIGEYGSADDPRQFPYLLAYSPYHNVRDDREYPSILITTADTDDRVSPGMAKKFAARLQAASGNPNPVLIRVETRAGHGAGKPVAKLIDEDADIMTFMFTMIGVVARGS